MDAWLQNVCASMRPWVTEWSMSAAALVINVGATWEYFPRAVWALYLFFSLAPLMCTLSLIHSGRADWLSAVRVQTDTVFISLAFRVRLWSVSCWLRVNMQHLITSLGFWLKGHKGPMYHCERSTETETRIHFKGPWLPFCFHEALVVFQAVIWVWTLKIKVLI